MTSYGKTDWKNKVDLEQIFNATANGIRIIDKNFNVQQVNKSFLGLTGLNQEEALRKKCYEGFHIQLCHTPKCTLTCILNGGKEHVKFNVENKRKDGTIIPCILTATPLQAINGELIGIIEDFKDITECRKIEKKLKKYRNQLEELVERRTSVITAANKQLQQEIIERKKTEEKLKKALKKIQIHKKNLEMINDYLDSFAYSVSHDLRAPLRAISGFSQVLLDTYRAKVDAEMRHYLERISKGVQKMGQLIDDLLYFSRATRSEIKYEKVDVEKIVNDIVKAHKGLAKNVEFIVNPLGEVEADKQMIKIVFVNLLQNAVKYTYKCKKPCIEIGSEQKRGEIQFFVKDNGIGFDMKYKDKLFEAFQRFHTDKEYEGSGIGLATVKRIVSKHNGKVWAEGEVGKGATFYFTLPVKKLLNEQRKKNNMLLYGVKIA